ncbi:unnamed protein product [Trichobilharzia regenti]|nr:unnamed protein product [Trichobilharzia regenti]
MDKEKREMNPDMKYLTGSVVEGSVLQGDKVCSNVEGELNSSDESTDVEEPEDGTNTAYLPTSGQPNSDNRTASTDVKESEVNSDLLVIGAGLMRSGTTSLKSALEYLYKKQCYHMREIVFNLREPHIKSWLWAIEQDRQKKTIPKEFWTHLYRDFSTAVDYPTAGFYKHLSQVYPNAKVILTVRDPDEWVRSCRATTLSEIILQKPTIGQRIIHRLYRVHGLHELHHQMFRQTLGEDFYTASDEHLRNAYISWNEEVVKSIPAERLLVFDSTQGWKPLCEFLGLPVPSSNIAYPHLNERDVMIQAISESNRPCQWVDRFLTFILYLLLPVFFAFMCMYYASGIYERISFVF